MYHVSAQGVDERMINVHYYYYCRLSRRENPSSLSFFLFLPALSWSVKVSLREPSQPSLLSEPPETCRSSFLLILLFWSGDLHLVLDSTKRTVHFCTEFVFQ